MRTLSFHPDIQRSCPDFHVGLLSCTVENSMRDEALWRDITSTIRAIQSRTALDAVNTHPVIAATRAAYKRCGKDPNRYRPSAEALRRRIIRGKGLFAVSTLVDVVNLVSLETGFSIGSFDQARLTGDLAWGIGRDGEAFEGIGRGSLNIAGLPVLRDDTGAVGTPTSDSTRAMLSLQTSSLLVVVNAFHGAAGLEAALDALHTRLRRHAGATRMEAAVARCVPLPGGGDVGH